MTDSARHDAWQAGENYEAYMGRWSRRLAPKFLDWLAPASGLDWLEVGCGTGALSATILAQCEPSSLIAIDQSAGFIAAARSAINDPCAEFRVADAQNLPLPDASRDVVASALVLNFVPDKNKALAEMKRVARTGATIGIYVWDYPGGGMEMMRTFWAAAAELDSNVGDLTEDKRFPFCTPEGLTGLLKAAGFSDVECAPIMVPTVFKDFDDYWEPFTLGTGPAPGYCIGLSQDARQRLREKLDVSLPRNGDGSISLSARAWALKARAW